MTPRNSARHFKLPTSESPGMIPPGVLSTTDHTSLAASICSLRLSSSSRGQASPRGRDVTTPRQLPSHYLFPMIESKLALVV
jgi:hypothetical protein